MSTVYLAGPMRGLPHFNFQTFEDASWDLTLIGYHVVSPHQYDIDTHRVDARWHLEPPLPRHHRPRRVFDSVRVDQRFDFESVIGDDLKLIQDLCNAIVLLPGWAQSEGATRELDHAESLGYPSYFFDPTGSLLTRLSGTF